MENLTKLKELAKNTKVKASIDNLRTWISRNKLRIYNQIRLLKTQRKFEVALIYAKRNRIIHEGAINLDGLIYINKFLEHLLEDAILNLIPFQNKRTINNVALELNKPFKNNNNILNFDI